MSWFKRLKKATKPSKHLAPLGTPSHIDVAPLGITAELEPEIGSEAVKSGKDSRFPIEDGRNQQSHTSAATSTSASGHRDDATLAREHDREGVLSIVTNEQGGPTHDIPNLSSADGREPGARDQVERQDQGTVTDRPSEGLDRNASGGDRLGGDVDEVAHSEGSRSVERHFEGRTPGDAVTPADKAIRGFDSLGVALSKVHANYKEITGVKNKVEDLHSRVDALEKQFDSRPSNVTEQRRRNEIICQLKEIEGRLQIFSGEPEPQEPADSAHDHGGLTGLLEDLREAIFNYQTKQQEEMHNRRRQQINQAEAAVLNHFHSAKGAEYRHGNRKGCLKGTRVAVLDEIGFWARDFDRSPIYWLNGLAGTGKSTIAQTIAERLFADGQLGASFFCSRDFEDRRNLQLIFPTIAVQLARNYPEFRSAFAPLAQSDPGISHENLHNQMEKLITEPLRESAVSTVIVIDALDECKDEETTSAILSVLGRFISEVPKVKFFLTGRPEPRIRTGFRLPLLKKVTDVFVLHGVEQGLVTEDIHLFLKTRFLEMADYRDGLDGLPTNGEIGRLCKRAAGLFVYAVATVKFIDKQNSNPRRQLELLLQSPESSAREAKTKFKANTTLDSLYTSILQEALGEDGDPDNDPKARSVLGAMILAANPLSPSTIATLLGLDSQDILPLLSSVQSLLILQEDIDYPVRPFHKSFPDFIIDPDRCTNRRFYISPPDHHSQLLSNCLKLMDRLLESNMCKLPDGVANSDIGDLKERIERHIDPALQYACRSWHMHLVDRHTTHLDTQEFTSALHRFLERKFLFWLEVLSVLGAVRNAVDALRAAGNLLEESPTLDLTNDCSRFVTTYFEVIDASAPHIYLSALVLSPKTSTVRKHYESCIPPFPRVVHGAPVSWDSSIAAARISIYTKLAVWSPCSTFIAMYSYVVDILDSATLQRLQTLRPPPPSDKPQALAFSPDSCMLTLSGHAPHELFVVTWDLQTGGMVSNIKQLHQRKYGDGVSHITHSADGKMVAVYRQGSISFISIYDVVSGVHVYDVHPGGHTDSHPPTNLRLCGIWTHGEYFRFSTFDLTTIVTSEVGFAPGSTPTLVDILRIPAKLRYINPRYIQFLPASCRHVLVYGRPRREVLVLDAQQSRSNPMDIGSSQPASISSDGRFFASLGQSEMCLWKESSVGYVPQGKLATGGCVIDPLLSPNGESIIAVGDTIARLFHIKSFYTTLPGISTRDPKSTEDHILEFHPDMPLAAVTRFWDDTVTVLDLKSGAPQLTINAGRKVYGLRLIGHTVVVISNRKVVTWNLLGGNFPLDGRVGIEDSAQTINFDGWRGHIGAVASISSDLRYIAFSRLLNTADNFERSLRAYDVSTGRLLPGISKVPREIRFAQEGHRLWCINLPDPVEVILIKGGGLHMEKPEDVKKGSWGCPWSSSSGYHITEDRWILGPDGRRLLMLPCHWLPESLGRQPVWSRQFLALLHSTLSEPVILELEL